MFSICVIRVSRIKMMSEMKSQDLVLLRRNSLDSHSTLKSPLWGTINTIYYLLSTVQVCNCNYVFHLVKRSQLTTFWNVRILKFAADYVHSECTTIVSILDFSCLFFCNSARSRTKSREIERRSRTRGARSRSRERRKSRSRSRSKSRDRERISANNNRETFSKWTNQQLLSRRYSLDSQPSSITTVKR